MTCPRNLKGAGFFFGYGRRPKNLSGNREARTAVAETRLTMIPDRRMIGSITLRVIVLTLPALTGAGFFVGPRPHCRA
jgi:hypothetical protein